MAEGASAKYPPRPLPTPAEVKQRREEIAWREGVQHVGVDLAPMEHLIIGSTPEDVSGARLDTERLLEAAQQGDQDAYDSLLIPLRIQREGTSALHVVQRARMVARDNRELRGIAIMEVDPLIAQEGLAFCFEPSTVDSVTKRVGPSKISLVDQNGNVIPRDWGSSQIASERTRFFRLEPPVAGQPYRLLSPNLPLPK